MELIKQLGGYEKAKRELQLKEQNSVLQCCIAVTAEMIRDALLEHRREHNIFEVGDKVVFINDVYADYGNVVSIDFIGKFDLMVSDHTKGFQLNEFCAWSKIIRHATDEEIAAGHRL